MEGRLLQVFYGRAASGFAGGYIKTFPQEENIFNYMIGDDVTELSFDEGGMAFFYSDGTKWYLLTGLNFHT